MKRDEFVEKLLLANQQSLVKIAMQGQQGELEAAIRIAIKIANTAKLMLEMTPEEP